MANEIDPRRSLTREQVVEIYTTAVPSGVLAERFGVAVHTVNAVRHDDSYLDITKDLEQPPLIGHTRYGRKDVQWRTVCTDPDHPSTPADGCTVCLLLHDREISEGSRRIVDGVLARRSSPAVVMA